MAQFFPKLVGPLLMLGYVAAAALGMLVVDTDLAVSMLWLPTGIACGCLLRFGVGYWPWIALGALVSDWVCDTSVGAWIPLLALTQAAGPAVMALGLRRTPFDARLNRASDVARFVFGAAGAMVVPAMGGVLALTLSGLIDPENVATAAVCWYLGDVVGVLLGAPVILGARREEVLRKVTGHTEFAVWVILSLAASAVLLRGNHLLPGPGMLGAFASIPLVLWGSMRFGALAGAFAPVVLAGATAMGAANESTMGGGAFVEGITYRVWAYAALLCSINLVTVMLQAERRAAERRSSDARALLQASADAHDAFLAQASLTNVLTGVVRAAVEVSGARIGAIIRTGVPAQESVVAVYENERPVAPRFGNPGPNWEHLPEGLLSRLERSGGDIVSGALDVQAISIDDQKWSLLGFECNPGCANVLALAGGSSSLSSANAALLNQTLKTCGALMNAHQARVEQIRASARIAELAQFDPLTGLANRRHMTEVIAEFSSSEHLSGYLGCLYLDLDNFKTINDTFGHEVGDQVLLEVARRIQQIQAADAFSARLGGDEFVVLLTGLSQNAAIAYETVERFASDLVRSLRRPCTVDDKDVRTSGSIGVSIQALPLESSSDILRSADAALYVAKREGRDRYSLFTDEIQNRVERDSRIRHDLNFALQRGELCFARQVIVDRQGIISGVELLARWPHPLLGMLSPDEFVPIIEKRGRARKLGELALIAACKEILRSTARGEHIMCSVNVSADHLEEPQFVDRFLGIVDSFRVSPQMLTVELTETRAINFESCAADNMARLRRLGVRLLIDDFGSGYASLTYLKQLPVTGLKLSRAFTADVATNPVARRLIRSVVALSHEVGLWVVAEGVETVEQLDVLKEVGCDAFQGYLWGRPAIDTTPPPQTSADDQDDISSAHAFSRDDDTSGSISIIPR
jgi:diguanylate cyclase (GGDEF)-like protein